MRKLMIVLVLLSLALPASAAEPKNVKLLTGLSEGDLHWAMNEMRASLGTHCDYCHVIKGKWDFASDEKPEKNRARDMIKMVADINRTTFGGHEVVSCWTCHRGSIKPVNLVSLPQPPVKFPTPRPEKPQLLDAREVVKKYATSLGDVALWKMPRVTKGERTDFNQKVTTFELAEKNSKIHISAPGREQAFNGESGWWRDEKQTAAMTEGELMQLQILGAAYAPVLPSDVGDDAKTIAKEKIDDRDVWVVANGTLRFYFDVESGLLVRKATLTPSPVGTIPKQSDFDDYRDAGGVKFPFRIRVSFVDPWAGATRQYTEVKMGAEVDDAMFEKPKASP